MERINNLINILNNKKIDGFLITSEANITYLTGFTGDSSRLIVSPKGCTFMTDGRYTEQAQLECHPKIEIIKWINDERYGTKTYNRCIHDLNIKKLAFEGSVISYSTYQYLTQEVKGCELIPVDGVVEKLRLVKDEKEIEFLKEASKISDKALELTVPYIKPGISEIEILARLEFNLKTNGADDLSFETMVLSGAKTSLLHGKADSKNIEKGDLVLFDFGALYKGYHADISRTFAVGTISSQQQEMYEVIQKAQAEACNSIKAGVHGTIPDTTVRNIIPDKYIDYYYPGLGHGVGLVIHEEPFIKNTCDFIFKEGMVLTIEPGIYIPGIGGLRIEDTIVVKKNGFELLNKFPKDLKIL